MLCTWQVTNVSAGLVIALYTPLLLVDYTTPFRACDAGLPQELVFVQQPLTEAVAAVPLSPPPVVLVRDGFGARVRDAASIIVQLRIVPAESGDAAEDGDAGHLSSDYVTGDLSEAAQLGGASRLLTTYSDPLGLDPFGNTTDYHSQVRVRMVPCACPRCLRPSALCTLLIVRARCARCPSAGRAVHTAYRLRATRRSLQSAALTVSPCASPRSM